MDDIFWKTLVLIGFALAAYWFTILIGALERIADALESKREFVVTSGEFAIKRKPTDPSEAPTVSLGRRDTPVDLTGPVDR